MNLLEITNAHLGLGLDAIHRVAVAICMVELADDAGMPSLMARQKLEIVAEAIGRAGQILAPRRLLAGGTESFWSWSSGSQSSEANVIGTEASGAKQVALEKLVHLVVLDVGKLWLQAARLNLS